MVDQTAQSWIQDIYSEEWTEKFHHQVQKFREVADARQLVEDARQILATKLIRIAADGDSNELSPGYVLAAFWNALIDAHRTLFGRAKPRKWLSDLGAIGKRLFELRCLQRLSESDVVAKVRDKPSSSGDSPVSEARVREILREMERRNECAGLASNQTSSDETNDDGQPVVAEPTAPESVNPEERAAREQAKELQKLLFGSIPERLSPALRKRLEDLQRKSGRSLLLDDEECLILQYFSNDMQERLVGELLGGLSVRQVRSRRKKSMEKIKRFFERAGLSLDDLID